MELWLRFGRVITVPKGSQVVGDRLEILDLPLDVREV